MSLTTTSKKTLIELESRIGLKIAERLEEQPNIDAAKAKKLAKSQLAKIEQQYGDDLALSPKDRANILAALQPLIGDPGSRAARLEAKKILNRARGAVAQSLQAAVARGQLPTHSHVPLGAEVVVPNPEGKEVLRATIMSRPTPGQIVLRARVGGQLERWSFPAEQFLAAYGGATISKNLKLRVVEANGKVQEGRIGAQVGDQVTIKGELGDRLVSLPALVAWNRDRLELEGEPDRSPHPKTVEPMKIGARQAMEPYEPGPPSPRPTPIKEAIELLFHVARDRDETPETRDAARRIGGHLRALSHPGTLNPVSASNHLRQIEESMSFLPPEARTPVEEALTKPRERWTERTKEQIQSEEWSPAPATLVPLWSWVVTGDAVTKEAATVTFEKKLLAALANDTDVLETMKQLERLDVHTRNPAVITALATLAAMPPAEWGAPVAANLARMTRANAELRGVAAKVLLEKLEKGSAGEADTAASVLLQINAVDALPHGPLLAAIARRSSTPSLQALRDALTHLAA